MEIGIFGGSFNPVHIGHLIAAEEVYQQRSLTKVIFVPTGISPHKEAGDLIDSSHRYHMVKSAICDNDHFEISDIEMKRDGKSYTIDTIRIFKKIYGEEHSLYLIIGTDMINEINTWKDIHLLSHMCQFIVVNRFPIQPNENLNVFTNNTVVQKGKETIIKNIEVKIPPIGISSTEIRERSHNNRSIRYLVPQCVEKYIKMNNLYANR